MGAGSTGAGKTMGASRSGIGTWRGEMRSVGAPTHHKGFGGAPFESAELECESEESGHDPSPQSLDGAAQSGASAAASPKAWRHACQLPLHHWKAGSVNHRESPSTIGTAWLRHAARRRMERFSRTLSLALVLLPSSPTRVGFVFAHRRVARAASGA